MECLKRLFARFHLPDATVGKLDTKYIRDFETDVHLKMLTRFTPLHQELLPGKESTDAGTYVTGCQSAFVSSTEEPNGIHACGSRLFNAWVHLSLVAWQVNCPCDPLRLSAGQVTIFQKGSLSTFIVCRWEAEQFSMPPPNLRPQRCNSFGAMASAISR